MKTFVIAEAGANHNRDWRIAKQLIYAAASAGASAVKFQNYTSEKLYSRHTPDFGNYKDIPNLISSIELPKDWCKDLKSMCDDCGIEFMSTPFDEDSVDLLVKVGVKRMKIASFESKDVRLVRHIASTGLPIIFSAGISTGIKEIRNILNVIQSVSSNSDITVLHCNSSYPTPISDINLGQMSLIDKEFGSKVRVGLSDHTMGILIPPVAVALGAKVIEKHYTLSRKMTGPDHPYAIEPDELFNMCRNIAEIETSLSIKSGNELTESEKFNDMKFALRSIVASKHIKAGEKLSIDNITTKRPFIEGNIPASSFDDVIGNYVAKHDIEQDVMISFDLVHAHT